MRDSAAQLRPSSGAGQERPNHGRALLRPPQARPLPEGQGRRGIGKRRRNSALLLNSSSNRPHGLANSSGLVGKYLMFNHSSAVHAQFEHELNEYKSVQVTRIIHDFYDADPQRGFYGGGGIDARMGAQPLGWALAGGGELPGWGVQYKERLEAFPRSMVAAGHGTSLAMASNNVSIDPSLKDAWGIPAIRVTYKDHPDDLAMGVLQDRCVAIMQAAGAVKTWRAAQRLARGGVHLLGTCRDGQ